VLLVLMLIPAATTTPCHLHGRTLRHHRARSRRRVEARMRLAARRRVEARMRLAEPVQGQVLVLVLVLVLVRVRVRVRVRVLVRVPRRSGANSSANSSANKTHHVSNSPIVHPNQRLCREPGLALALPSRCCVSHTQAWHVHTRMPEHTKHNDKHSKHKHIDKQQRWRSRCQRRRRSL